MKIRLITIVASMLLSVSVSAGTLYTIDESGSDHGRLYSLSKLDGSATLVQEISNAGDLSPSLLGGAYDSSRDTLFFTTYFFESSNAGLASVDRETGAGVWVGEHIGPSETSNVFATAYDSLNDVLYASDSDTGPRTLVTINRDTGEETVVGPHGEDEDDISINGMAYDPATDTLYGVDGSDLFSLNRTTGEATSVGSHGLDSNTQMGLAVDPDDGIMYLVHGDNQGLYTVNKSNGSTSLVGLTGLNDIGSLAAIPGGATNPVPLMGDFARLLMILAVLMAAFAFRGKLQRARVS